MSEKHTAGGRRRRSRSEVDRLVAEYDSSDLKLLRAAAPCLLHTGSMSSGMVELLFTPLAVARDVYDQVQPTREGNREILLAQ